MIKLSLEEKMLFVRSYIENEIELEAIGTKPNPKFEKTILAEFESLLELSETKNLVNWHKSLENPKLKVEDLKERIIETSSGKILIGIRFLGMDISKPFVNIWTSFPIEKELELIIYICKQEFKMFQPKHIRFWINPNSDFGKRNKEYVCQNYLVGNIKVITSTEKPINYESIELELITDLKFYDWYVELYNEFYKKNPDLKSFVTTNSIDIFEENIKQKLCYYIRFCNKNIGIIATEKDNYFGVPSLYMNEIVISEKYKGLKLATAAQRKLIELNQKDVFYIWGSIDKKNIPSTKNALRVGRKVISSEILLPI